MEHNSGTEIPTALARQLVKNYKDNKRKNARIERDETLAVWFDIDILCKMLKVEKGNSDISGVRIYLAAYPEKQHEGRIPEKKEYENKMTLIMVQTKQSGLTHEDELKDRDDPPGYPKMLVYNDGQICPPPDCPVNGLLRFIDES